jgi:anti-sigma regulatory factor (Ser/Thr protein kinase)
MTTLSLTEDRQWLAVSDVHAAGTARRIAATLGTEAGLGPDAQADLAIVATELATNLARHADEGRLLLRLRRIHDAAGVELIAVDAGPGMADIVESTRDGYSTAGSLGIGLGAIARKAHEFDVYTRAGAGTVQAATVWATRPGAMDWVDGVSRPMTGQEACGDGYVAREIEGRRQVLLCDGLGHGPLASVAARAAVAEFAGAPAMGPAELLRRVHERIRHTRGVVAGIAEIEPEQVRYAGIGNVLAAIVDGSRRRIMVSLPGIVGQQQSDTREFTYPLSSGSLVVLHSDGLTDKWDLSDRPGLTGHAPVVIAATLLRDWAKRRDDAAVLVARAP